MATRSVKTTPFKEGQNTNDHKGDAPKTKVISNASKGKSADPGTGLDRLTDALGVRNQVLPIDNHKWTHTTTVEPVGANYARHVTGEFGRVTPTGQGKGVYSYGGAPNRKGENALGKALGGAGEKSGYPKFKPKAGGGKKL